MSINIEKPGGIVDVYHGAAIITYEDGSLLVTDKTTGGIRGSYNTDEWTRAYREDDNEESGGQA